MINLSDKRCKILGSFLQYNAFFLKKIARIRQKVQEMQGLGRFWQNTSDLSTFPAKNVCWADQNFLARFFQKTCKIFLYLQDNSVVRFLQVVSDASLFCKILARYLWRIIYGIFSFFNIKYSLEYLIMPLLTSSSYFSKFLAAVSSGNKLTAIIPIVALAIFHQPNTPLIPFCVTSKKTMQWSWENFKFIRIKTKNINNNTIQSKDELVLYSIHFTDFLIMTSRNVHLRVYWFGKSQLVLKVQTSNETSERFIFEVKTNKSSFVTQYSELF